MFEIEKNVPVPTVYTTKPIYPFERMEVADSFFVPYKGNNKKREIGNLHNAARRAFKGSGFVTIHSTMDGIRVWRIK